MGTRDKAASGQPILWRQLCFYRNPSDKSRNDALLQLGLARESALDASSWRGADSSVAVRRIERPHWDDSLCFTDHAPPKRVA